MNDKKNSKTYENLQFAFSIESQASARYSYFEKIAKAEKQEKAAELFKETAVGEQAHAIQHLEFLKRFKDPASDLEIGNTKQNLEAAIHSETHEYTDLYPGMAKTAREEGHDDIADWLETLSKAERSHAGKFEAILARLK